MRKPNNPAVNDPHGETDIPLRERLNAETGVLSWEELTPHFARGVVLRVSEKVDLIDAAEVIIRDDKATVETWIANDDIRRATDDDARSWVQREPTFWCVVSAPWVLVQEKTGTQSS